MSVPTKKTALHGKNMSVREPKIASFWTQNKDSGPGNKGIGDREKCKDQSATSDATIASLEAQIAAIEKQIAMLQAQSAKIKAQR